MAKIPIEQLLDKKIYARLKTKIYRVPGGEVVYTANPGTLIGTVYSWINPGPYSADFHLMFHDAYKKPYYVKLDNNLDLSAFIDQGAVDDKQKAKQEKDATKSKGQKFAESLQGLVLLLMGVAALKYGTARENRKAAASR